MTTDHRFDALLEGWLRAEAAMPAPPDLHSTAMDRARRSRSRPSWLAAVRGGTAGGSAWAMNLSRHRVAFGLIAAVLLLGLLGAALLAGAFRIEPSPLSQNGVIAYSAADGPQLYVANSIWFVESDGSAPRRVALGTCPQFGQHASVLAYTSVTSELIVDEITDGAVAATHRLSGLGRTDYALSQDGTRVAWFQRASPSDNESGPTELWVRDVAGGPAVRIMPATENLHEIDSTPSWSPDGRQIAFARSILVDDGQGGGTAYRSAITLIDSDGTDVHDISIRMGMSPDVSWSPDGKWLAYLGFADGTDPIFGQPGPAEETIYVVAANGTAEVALPNTAPSATRPRWSPDGSRLAYLGIGGQAVLTIVRMDGGRAVGSPVAGPAVDSFDWSPDGTRLATLADTVVDGQSTGGTISTVDADLRTAPVTLRVLDGPVTCGPTWQRLAP
jgi:Tol biopolymer transport system component